MKPIAGYYVVVNVAGKDFSLMIGRIKNRWTATEPKSKLTGCGRTRPEAQNEVINLIKERVK